MRIHSGESTALAYDGTRELGDLHPLVPVGTRVTLHPGVNELSDNDFAILAADRNFRSHVASGVHHFLNEDGSAMDANEIPPPKEYQPAPVPNALDTVNSGAETLPDFRTDAAGVAGDRTNPTTGEIQGVAQVDARKRLDGESDKKYAARMTRLDAGAPPAAALPEAVAKEREDYFGLSPEDRAAMYPALSPEGKAAVDADDRSKALA
jgi:hypothetical protein